MRVALSTADVGKKDGQIPVGSMGWEMSRVLLHLGRAQSKQDESHSKAKSW